MNSKILSQEKLVKTVRFLKKQGKKIVVVNGSFDLMHVGHLKFLQAARRQGDILLVLVNSDCSVKKYKGPNRPVIGEKERMEMVAAISEVNYISLFDGLNPKDLVARIRPDVYCNGSDWGKYCVEKETVEAGGGRVHIIKRGEKEPTTSEIVRKILEVYSKPQVKAIFIDRDGTINDNRNGYVHKIRDFRYLPGAVKALKEISKTDYKIIIITNQSGIGRNYFKRSDYDKLTKFMLRDFRKKGIRIDKIYFCPHGPKGGCNCRKPAPGMLLAAVRDFGISLNDSWLIGDDYRDIVMGREANVKTIKIGGLNAEEKMKPNFLADNLSEAVKIILSKN